MVWTLFVLDFDGTYSLEMEDDFGVTPTVYLIPDDKIVETQKCAFDAGMKFSYNDELDSGCIGDYFAEFMEEQEIPFKEIGNIDLTFGERQVDYLADYIPREIV